MGKDPGRFPYPALTAFGDEKRCGGTTPRRDNLGGMSASTQPLDDLLAVLAVARRTVADLERCAPTEDTEAMIFNNENVITCVEAELARREQLAQRLLAGVGI